MSDFNLDTRLENDSVLLCTLKLSQVRLHKNAAFPWVMLIPERNDISEIMDLNDDDQDTLYNETIFVANIMRKIFKPKKMNIANLGNVVPQLHVHVIARYETDKAWPGPVWNSGVSETYDEAALQTLTQQLKTAFSL